MEPKTLPNPFFKAFCGLLFPIENLPRFFIDVLLIFCRFSRAQRMKNSGFSMGKHYILQNRHFQDKCEKSSKKPAKILPKSTQNPPKTDQETKNIDKKSDADLSFAKKAKKTIKNAKKWPKSPPKGWWANPRRHTRSLLRRGRSPSQGRFRREVGEVPSNTLGGRGPPRIGTLRGASRDSAGVLT